MSTYTTGEIAKICGVSIRTVQYYDTKNILKPSSFSEGGRRLYNEQDIQTLNLICLFKSIGLSLSKIKEILEDKEKEALIILIMNEQLKSLKNEEKELKNKIETINVIKDSIKNKNTIPVNSINDIEKIMNNTKNVKNTHKKMLFVGIVMDIIEIFTLVLGITKGIWLPFILGMFIVLILGILITNMYYKNSAYICSKCQHIFKPALKTFIFSKHTPKTRKLTCSKCGYNGYFAEIYDDKK